MKPFVLDGCSALITGASAGIGREFALQLGPRAGALVLVARRRDRLEELRNELRARNPNLVVHIRDVDLSKQWQLDEFLNWLTRVETGINFLINNAGLGDRGLFATSDPVRVEEMTMVNMVALTKITRRLLPELMTQKRSAILNVSSSASFLPMPTFAVYAATKAYVTSFSEALRAELRTSGVTVTSLCPGPVHTEFNDVAKRPNEQLQHAGPEITYVAVEEVVRAALVAVERDQALVVPGVMMKLGMLIMRSIPLPLLRLVLPLAVPKKSEVPRDQGG